MAEKSEKGRAEVREFSCACRMILTVEAGRQYKVVAAEERTGWVISLVDERGRSTPLSSSCENQRLSEPAYH